MPLLRKGVLMPVKGIDFSVPGTFIDDRNSFPMNMRFYRGELRKRPGKTVIGAVAGDSTQIMGLGKLEMSSGLRYLVRNSKGKLELYDTGTGLWGSIASTPFSGGDDDFFSYATVTESDLLIITNGVDKIRKWGGSGNNAALGGSPPLAKYCCYISPYLLIAYTNDGAFIKPWAIQWCDTAQPEVWTGGNSGGVLISNEPSAIQNIVKLNEFAACYKEKSIWLGRKVETSDIFIFDPIKTGIGLGSPRSVAEAEGIHYFMGQNDFYYFNGIQITPIGAPVRDYIFTRIDRSKIDRCFAITIEELSEVWFFVIITGYSWPTEVWKFNYKLGFWMQDSCDQLTAAISWARTTTQSWDEDPGAWDSDQGPWDAGVGVTDYENVMFGLSTGYTHQLDYTVTEDNLVAVDANVTTKDFTGDQLEFKKAWLKLDVFARGVGKLYTDYSVDEGGNYINIPYDPNGAAYADMDGISRKYTFYFHILADKIRFRFRNANSGETFYLRNFYPYYIVKEEGKFV